MRLAVAGVAAVLAIVFGLLVEHLGHVWDQPVWIPILDLGVGWVLVGSGLVGAIARPSQPAGPRLVLAGFLWFIGTPQQLEFPTINALAFGFQGYFDLVLVLVVLSFPGRWPARREERAILVALAVASAARSVARIVARATGILGPSIFKPHPAYDVVAWADIALVARTGHRRGRGDRPRRGVPRLRPADAVPAGPADPAGFRGTAELGLECHPDPRADRHPPRDPSPPRNQVGHRPGDRRRR
jgi:hypothetical protein